MEKVCQVPELKLRCRDGAALLLFAAQVQDEARVSVWGTKKKEKADIVDCRSHFYQKADGVRRAAVCE